MNDMSIDDEIQNILIHIADCLDKVRNAPDDEEADAWWESVVDWSELLADVVKDNAREAA